jgi:hypothetical protein
MNEADFDYFQLFSAHYAGEDDYPLWEIDAKPIWPGHVGYLAVKDLVDGSESGALSVRLVCERIADGASVNQAFLEVFGVSKTAFEQSWEIPPLE